MVITRFGQCQQSDDLNIYSESLKWHLEYIKSFKALSEQEVYVEKNDVTTLDLPERIGEIKITCLSKEEIKAKTKSGNRIHLVVIRPVIVENSSLKVGIIDFYVSSKKRSFNYANTGGSILRFSYDCELAKFKLIDKKYSGI